MLLDVSALMILVLPGPGLNSIEQLKGHTIGAFGSEINSRIVEALAGEPCGPAILRRLRAANRNH